MVVTSAAAVIAVPISATRAGSAVISLAGAAGDPSPVLSAVPGVARVVSARVSAPAQAPLLRWPMRGSFAQGFGPSPYWFEPTVTVGRTTYWHFHTGIDIAAPWGTPVGAAADGSVEFAGWSSDGYGYTVVLVHGGGIRTLYAHLERVSVHRGQTVDAGTIIGLCGATGNATGPHLHFEVRPAPDSVIDPLLLLTGNDVAVPAVPLRWKAPGS